MDMKIEHQRLGDKRYLVTEDYPWHIQDRMNLLFDEGWRLVQIIELDGRTKIFWQDLDYDGSPDPSTDKHSAFDEEN